MESRCRRLIIGWSSLIEPCDCRVGSSQCRVRDCLIQREAAIIFGAADFAEGM